MSGTLEVLGFGMYAGEDEGGAGGFEVRRKGSTVLVWAGPLHLIVEKVRKPEATIASIAIFPWCAPSVLRLIALRTTYARSGGGAQAH